jgi:creatinine amidohydrolase
MGLDALKAHKVCCAAARTIGGVVFPPHYYAGVHRMSDEQIAKYTGQWGNIYTDRTARDNLTDIVRQIAIAGTKVLVLYSGHYPGCQVEMMDEVRAEAAARSGIVVIPFCECLILQGDHAGISETSFMLYLDKNLVDMTRIGRVNYQDHGWREENSPEKASAAKGERDVQAIITYLKGKIEEALGKAQ